MKPNDLYQELFKFAKAAGVNVRKEAGRFKSGFCYVNDNKIVILNKMASPDYMCKILALSTKYFELDISNCKEEINKYISGEVGNTDLDIFTLEIDAATKEATAKEKK